MKTIQKYSVELIKESSKRYELESKSCNSSINTAEILKTVLNMDKLPTEQFAMLALDTKLNVIGVHVITQGTINQSLVSTRDVFQRALLNNATCIVIAHNHPSGDVEPSNADFNVTKRIKDAGKLLDIKLLDHFIIGYDNYYSFAENGNL